MKKDELAYSANHNYREGYEDGLADAFDVMQLGKVLQDIVYAQGMINRSVFVLNRLMGGERCEPKRMIHDAFECPIHSDCKTCWANAYGGLWCFGCEKGEKE